MQLSPVSELGSANLNLRASLWVFVTVVARSTKVVRRLQTIGHCTDRKLRCTGSFLVFDIDSAGIVKPVAHAVIRRGGKASNFEGE